MIKGHPERGPGLHENTPPLTRGNVNFPLCLRDLRFLRFPPLVRGFGPFVADFIEIQSTSGGAFEHRLHSNPSSFTFQRHIFNPALSSLSKTYAQTRKSHDFPTPDNSIKEKLHYLTNFFNWMSHINHSPPSMFIGSRTNVN